MDIASLVDDGSDAIAIVASAAVGVVGGVVLVCRGLAKLGAAVGGRGRLIGAISGVLAGATGALAAVRAESWWLLLPLFAWASAIAAAAACDALTQRVPTSLVRQYALLVVALVLAASASTGHWSWLLASASVAVVAWLIFGWCWRFLSLGFGDVRIAVLGGLGQVAPTRLGALIGVGMFALITLAQAVTVIARGGSRRAPFPYGPAIAAGFLLAAIA
jgi:leader peptidase (prepilin peptidase) / N-methyltransferase